MIRQWNSCELTVHLQRIYCLKVVARITLVAILFQSIALGEGNITDGIGFETNVNTFPDSPSIESVAILGNNNISDIVTIFADGFNGTNGVNQSVNSGSTTIRTTDINFSIRNTGTTSLKTNGLYSKVNSTVTDKILTSTNSTVNAITTATIESVTPPRNSVNSMPSANIATAGATTRFGATADTYIANNTRTTANTSIPHPPRSTASLYVTTAPTITPSPTTHDFRCALAECESLYTSNTSPLVNVTWRSEDGRGDWLSYNTTTDGAQLLVDLRLHQLATVEEAAEWTVLCVGAVHIASYSYHKEMTTVPVAAVELQTMRDVAVGVVRLRTRCWLDTGFFAECSPSFIPMLFMANLPLQYSTPLEEEFWLNLTSAAVSVKTSWVRKINISTFQGSIRPQWIYNLQIPSVQTLQISGNDWETPDKILRNMSNLVQLNLSSNNLESLPEGMLENMPNLKEIVLNGNSFSKVPPSISRLNKLEYLDLSNSIGKGNSEIDAEEIEQYPLRLKTLKITETNFPINLERALSLPHLHFLNVSGSHVKINPLRNSVSNVVILDMSNMFDMSDSYWFLFPDNFFSAMLALEILVLSRNNLFMFPDFPKGNNLTHLYASRNHIIVLNSKMFANLRKLEVLDLSRCNLRYLSESIYQDGTALKKIDFSHNSLSYISDSLFSPLPYLQEVDVSHNFIKTINLWKWKFRKLDLSSNYLLDLRSNMSAIEYVDLAYNQLQNLDIVLSSVQVLNISYNSLLYIPSDLWENISQALEVDLGGNHFLCCSFKDSIFLRDQYEISVLNLGSLEPVKCFIDTASKVLFGSFVYNESECRTTKESIGSFVIVITITVVLTFIAVISSLTLHFLQFRRKKFTLEHSLDTFAKSSPT